MSIFSNKSIVLFEFLIAGEKRSTQIKGSHHYQGHASSTKNLNHICHHKQYFSQTNLLFYLNYLIVGEREKQENQVDQSLWRASKQHKKKTLSHLSSELRTPSTQWWFPPILIELSPPPHPNKPKAAMTEAISPSPTTPASNNALHAVRSMAIQWTATTAWWIFFGFRDAKWRKGDENNHGDTNIGGGRQWM